MSSTRRRLVDRVEGGETTRWSSPEIFDLTNDEDTQTLDERIARGDVKQVYDTIDVIANDLFELRYPDRTHSNDDRDEFVHNICTQGDKFGVWVRYPWSAELVHFPHPQDYHELRTYRFRELLSQEEICKLQMARIAVFGMSVGSNVAIALARNGVGGAIAIGDMDMPVISNIGRANIDMRDVLNDKVDATAKNISYIDPFIEQAHFHDGAHDGMLNELTAFGPDLISDEVDDMRASALLRTYSAQHHLPYVTVSDVDDAAVLEVCRHDTGKSPLYASHLRDAIANTLMHGDMSDAQETNLFARTIGCQHITPRLVESVMGIAKTVSGIPQLGSTALASAGLAVVADREILLGKTNVQTGRTHVSLSGAVGKHIKIGDMVRAARLYLKARS